MKRGERLKIKEKLIKVLRKRRRAEEKN